MYLFGGYSVAIKPQQTIDRNIAMELVRVTEAAAL